MMSCMTRAHGFMRRGRHALRLGGGIHELRDEVQSCRLAFVPLLATMRDRYSAVEQADTGAPSFLHAYFQRTYALALTVAIILVCILSTLDDETPNWDAEAVQLSKELIYLGSQAVRYRPLGASYMSAFLIAAWTGARADPATREAAQEMLWDYSKDFELGGIKHVSSLTALEWTSRRLRLEDAFSGEGEFRAISDIIAVSREPQFDTVSRKQI